MPNERKEVYLEPRVAKLEVGLDRLTDDVRNLATVVREQGNQMEQQIQQLIVAVTQAQGPKKTDWSTIIAAVMLILAIGSAAFWPLNQTSQENKQSLIRVEQLIDEHSKLNSHPVGMALIQRLEEQLQTHAAWGEKNHEVLAAQMKSESEITQKCINAKIDATQEKNMLYIDKLYTRVIALEDQNRLNVERERDELSLWRQKAMGLSSIGGNGHSHVDINHDTATKASSK